MDHLNSGLYLTGIKGVEPSQEVADPQKVLQNPLGVDAKNPPRDSIFLLNQYIYVQVYAAYASIETDVI